MHLRRWQVYDEAAAAVADRSPGFTVLWLGGAPSPPKRRHAGATGTPHQHGRRPQDARPRRRSSREAPVLPDIGRTEFAWDRLGPVPIAAPGIAVVPHGSGGHVAEAARARLDAGDGHVAIQVVGTMSPPVDAYCALANELLA